VNVAGPPGSAPEQRCRNCGAALSGHYCANCGQTADTHVLSARELLHETLEGLTHSDSRLWRTLYCLWFKPGMLTREFVDGRRQAYLPPVRLYLVLSVVFFLFASLLQPHAAVMTLGPQAQPQSVDEFCSQLNFTDSGKLGRFQARIQHTCRAVAADSGAGLVHSALALMPRAMFVLLPLMALLNMLLYWHPRHRYVEQLLFFLHLQAYVFSALTVAALFSVLARHWSALAGLDDWIGTLLLWSLPLYAVLAIRRYFSRGWVATLFKGAVLICAYFVVLICAVSVVFVYLALQL
jgi:hypothetical protein